MGLTGKFDFLASNNRSVVCIEFLKSSYIQGIWSNTSFIKVEGQNDEVDVKKSPLFSILKVKEIEDQLLCETKKVKSNRWSRTKFPGPVTP